MGEDDDTDGRPSESVAPGTDGNTPKCDWVGWDHPTAEFDDPLAPSSGFPSPPPISSPKPSSSEIRKHIHRSKTQRELFSLIYFSV